jgi:serine/threonine-protein kinase
MATVHVGRYRQGGVSKLVAVKRMHPQYARDEDFVEMFVDEAQMAARIRHPNVIATLELVRDAHEVSLVMEYVHGVTLSQLMSDAQKRGALIPLPVVLAILCGVLRGLHHAHEATSERGEPMELIHRDVTPENVLIGADGRARLIDFGVARALGRSTSTRTGQIKGKLSYLAPEQLKGLPLTRRVDVYGASVTLWQAITCRRLFAGDSAVEVALAILRDDVAPPGAMVAGVPDMIDRIVLKGLAQNPLRRWESARHMADAIERACAPASELDVGAFVRAISAERLERSGALVREAERAPVSITLAPPPIEDPRTQMTSEADRESDVRHVPTWVVAVAALLIGAAATWWLHRPETVRAAPAFSPWPELPRVVVPISLPSAAARVNVNESDAAVVRQPPRAAPRAKRWLPDDI